MDEQLMYGKKKSFCFTPELIFSVQQIEGGGVWTSDFKKMSRCQLLSSYVHVGTRELILTLNF